MDDKTPMRQYDLLTIAEHCPELILMFGHFGKDKSFGYRLYEKATRKKLSADEIWAALRRAKDIEYKKIHGGN